MPKRRGSGEGSIYRRKDGFWVGQYTVQTGSGRKRRYVYAKTRKEAASRLTNALAQRDEGLVYDSQGLNLGDYLAHWLGSIRGSVGHRTWERAESVVRVHLCPALGKTRLDRVDPLKVQALYTAKLGSGLSPRSVRIIHATLHKALDQAVKWQLVPRNAAKSVSPPRDPKKEMRPLDVGQVRRLLESARGDRLEALYVLAIATGMRSGELLGLKWEDVDLEAGTLQVRRSVFNGRVNTPKTAKGRRSIRLSKRAIEALGREEPKGDWVFATRAGTPWSVHNVHKRSWKPLLKKANLPLETRFHDLRHTTATLLLSKNVHPKVVQEMLGHSSISITLDTYSHVIPGMGEKAVQAMNEIF